MALASPYTRSFDGAQGLYLQASDGAAGFFDVVSGLNGSCGNYLCEAHPGYDGPTGLGSLRRAPEVPPPIPATGAAGSVTQTGATLGATVNPRGGRVDTCAFEYGTSTSYGLSAPCSSLPGSSTAPVGVSAAITGLLSGTIYDVRLVVGYSGSSAYGTDVTFTTLQSPPALTPAAPSGITSSAVTLNAQVNPEGAAVSECRFQYGPTAGYGESAPCASSPGNGRGPVAVSVSIGGLAANRTYHLQIVAGNAAGTSYGSDQTFTTIADAPNVVSGAASAITTTSATLNASVNPNGVPLTGCEFEFASLEHYVPCGSLPGPGETPVAVSAPVSALRTGTAFRYRIIAINAGGTSYGAIQEFTTLPATLATTPGLPSSRGARLSNAILHVSTRGQATARVFCPAGHGRCAGTITLRTLTPTRVAGSTSSKHILTLATGTFAVAAGHVASVTLRVSAEARALLGRAHALHAGVTLLTRALPGPQQAWRSTITLVGR
jgi:hypothetical protein